MKWSFPLQKTIQCNNCGEKFEITLVDRNSERHACPHCGTGHIFDFERAEKQLLEQTKEMLRKTFGKR